MAGSRVSSLVTDSRVRVHIPLPAVRPRQRSWGTSLPQSVIWIRYVGWVFDTHRWIRELIPLIEGTETPGRNGLPLVLRVMSNHVGTRGTHVRRFSRCLTHSRLPPVAWDPLSRCSGLGYLGGCRVRRPSALRMAISLPGLPPFLPPSTWGVLVPRAWRSRPGVTGGARHNY